MVKRIVTPPWFQRVLKGVTWLSVVLLLVFDGPPGATAQKEQFNVTLTYLNSQNFPEIIASVVVADTNGPVEGLTADNFEVLEGETQIPVKALVVEEQTTEPLRLVLAIHTSISAVDLAQIKTAVLPMIGALTPKDKAALLTFDDEVHKKYDFTNNTTALQAAINRLSPEGEKTALYQAVSKAAAMLDKFSTERKAIIVLTYNVDTVGVPSVDRVINRLQQAGVPLFIIGFGNQMQGASPLKAPPVLTGGQFLTANEFNPDQNLLLNLEESLRKGYTLTFQSALKADGKKHPVVIRVRGPHAEGAATGNFVATPGVIRIIPKGIAAHQTVWGVMNLAAEVISPASLATLSYWLDDQLLAQVTTPPYSFAWDSTTASAGNHRLTIEAVDQAGNKGKITINVVVDSPLRVTLAASRYQVIIGQPATVQVKIESLTGVERIDWLFAGKLLKSQTMPPYVFSLDSRQYPPGTYEITVRVQDRLGHTAEDSLTMEFLPPPLPSPGRLARIVRNPQVRLVFWVGVATVAILAVIVLAITLLVVVNRIQQKRAQRRGSVEIVNSGNIPSRYSLQASTNGGHLTFLFAINGKVLPVEPLSANIAATAVTGQTLSLQPASGQSQKNTRQKVEQIKAAPGKVYGGIYTLTQILDTLAQLLPGFAGSIAARASKKLLSTYAMADRTVRSQTQMVKTAGYFHQRVAGTMVNKHGGKSGHPLSYTGSASQAGEFRAGRVLDNNKTGALVQTLSPPVSRFQTPLLEPGEILHIELLIIPDTSSQPGIYNFTVRSQAIDLPYAPTVSAQGRVEIPGIFWGWRYLPAVGIVLAMLWLLWEIVTLTVWRVLAISAL